MYQNSYSMLGGKDFDFTQASTLDSINFLKLGLPVSMLDCAAKLMGMKKKHFISLIGGVYGSQYSRENDRLTLLESERMLMIIEVLAQAEQYYGDINIALEWLNTPSISLENEPPLTFLSSIEGIKSVKNSLVKLSHGMTA
ncbi:DUF2384 domain-containing protein [Shewanella sp. MMG014]|uniref:antitoxin Xre/MbcA/ParS toxin-binding domain-containing protein n=1 Tax=Shewanella sp. MMG014 TaxID=2822691 RepID=UPI001B35A5D8|nr:antitoxin Xre/MbcA/ParS toxin-binding domain-containing protein [Shewanella sp. MMG014]MBQ4889288.1 DUF2384 domain-containing protein [Shewanella sp. MMG014]